MKTLFVTCLIIDLIFKVALLICLSVVAGREVRFMILEHKDKKFRDKWTKEMNKRERL